jgi:serine/threonine protein kinase
MIGVILNGRYRLEAKLGSGGMSTVFLARDEVLDRPVAVKLMHAGISDQPDQLERFNQEARAVAKLSDNPNVVAVIDAGEHESRPYIVFEYVEGETLKQRIARQGALEATEALAYAVEVSQALEAAHQREMVHRDVKPQNVLIDATGQAKLTDFGISRQLNEKGVTAEGKVVGTTDYVAPEQAMGQDVDTRSDIYSLGVVLFEMLSGDVPFEAENQVGVAMKHIGEELPDIQVVRPDISSATARVVEKATAKSPDDRYQTIPEMTGDLQGALEVEAIRAGGTSGEATSVLDAVPPARRQLPDKRSRPWPAIILLVGAMLLAAGSAYVISQGNTPVAGGGGGPTSSANEIEIAGATDFDPIGGDGEHPEETGLAFDADTRGTAWTTETYREPTFGKDGVGLIIDVGSPVKASSIEVTTQNPGWSMEVYGATDGPPETLEDWTLLGGNSDIGEIERVDLIQPRRYRYYLIWATEPTNLKTGYGASISNVRVLR